MDSRIKHINPKELHQNPAFSQAVIANGAGQTIYIGGQNAVTANSQIIGKGNIKKQTEQALENIGVILQKCGCSFSNIVKLNIYLVDGQNALIAFESSKKYLREMDAPPAVSVLFVSGLANPEFLIEIEAIAFKPDSF